jgi:hypothetical protein
MLPHSSGFEAFLNHHGRLFLHLTKKDDRRMKIGRQVWSGIRPTSHPIASPSRETSVGGIGIFATQA